MPGTNDVLNRLASDKQMLIRKFDRHEISQEEFDAQVKEIISKTNEELVKVLASENESRLKREEEQKQMEAKAMAEEKAEKPKKAAASAEAKPRKGKENSLAALGESVLQMKSIKNLNTAVDKMCERRPGLDRKKAESRIKAIISVVKAGKMPRWQKYTWDEANYQLVLKQ
jgi:FKBP-type peptidyl-prolyl cis-trans isomerase